ncbi:hypothetical protein [Chromobacterium sp. CV08]|uniref:hypothetical protein n=1 Tax=Chromobacterium sp. CV08 TaxID=3133274 RepID=UPI003DA86A7F
MDRAVAAAAFVRLGGKHRQLRQERADAGAGGAGGRPAAAAVAGGYAAGLAKRHADSGKDGSSQLFDVVFIQSNGKLRKAYLVVDNKYGKMVRDGDTVQSWKVVAIGDDYVDIAHGGKRKRLLMDAGVPSVPEPR